MKKLSLYFILIAACTLARATPVAVPVNIWAEGTGASGGSLTAEGSFLESAPGANDGDVSDPKTGTGALVSDLGAVRAEPGRAYVVTLLGSNVTGVTLNVAPPPGFFAEIERVVRNRYPSGLGNFVVRILPQPAPAPRAASADVTGATGKIDWRVSLGTLQNGASAGELALIDAGYASDWSALYTPALLDYDPVSSEVQVHRNGGAIQQILANEAIVDVVTLSSISYELRFYHPTQKIGSSFPYTFTGRQPYSVYKIERDGGTNATKLKITRDSYEIPNATTTGVTTSRTEVMTMERSGTNWPNYDWTHTGWTLSGQTALTQRSIDSGGTASARTENAAIRVPGGNTSTSATRAYATKAWGEVITSETLGSTDSMTSTFAYYENSSQPGYTYIKSRTANSGAWEAYEYHDDTANPLRSGMVKFQHRPWLDAPSAVPSTLSSNTSGEITQYDYTTDAFGFYTRPSSVETKVNGTLTARSTFSYADTANVNGMTVVTATRLDRYDSNAANNLETLTRYYREDTADAFFRGQLYSVRRPDNAMVSYAYQRGTWSGSAFTKTGSDGLGAGTASRITVITGSASSSAGSSYTAHDGYDIDDLYLVDGKSTRQDVIRDSRALVVRTENYVRSAGAWQLIGSATLAYNFVGQLTGRTALNGAAYDADYEGRLLASETDESGVVVTYGYDVMARRLTVAKASGPTVTFAYNATGQVLTETVSGSGTSETIVTGHAYDDAGRLTSTTPPGLSPTTVAYNVTSRTRTVTAPDGGTSVSTQHADGRLKQNTGTAVVPQYYTYTIETDGRRLTQVNSGTLASPRLQKAWTDWLGRAVKSERPGFSQSTQAAYIEENFYDDTTIGKGRLYKTTRTGYAPTRYEYDALGSVVRSGLDVNNDGLFLASNDRISDSNTVVENIAGNWWVTTESKTYPTASSNAPVTTSKRARLTGFPSNRLAEVHEIDLEGNVVSRTTDVNRGTKTVTLTTTGPCNCAVASETMVNGLPDTVTTRDNLVYETDYDALGRKWKDIDPRSNVTTIAYYTGTTLVNTVTDDNGAAVSTIGYTTAGRTAWTQDAATKFTRFAYNQRGQVTHQWGDGTYPVAYDYDSTYGDRTGMSTFRGAPSADSATWPSVGTADTTAWSFDPASALLWKKTDAAGQPVEYDYNTRGQTSSRKWARTLTASSTKLATAYDYDSATGELLTVTYNDDTETIPTPDLTYTYNRAGQIATVLDGTGSRTFNYDPASPWRLANEAFSSFFDSRRLTRLYDATSGTGGTFGGHTIGTFEGRAAGYELGTTANPDRDLRLNHTYSNQNRFVGVSSGANEGTAVDFVYAYESGSRLIDGYTVGNFSTSRDYEGNRDLVSRIESKWSTTSLARFDFTHDARYQRTTAKQSGTAFADYYTGQSYSAVFNNYTYNARGELETAAMYRGDTPSTTPSSGDELPGRRFEYRYDSIGNRLNSGPTGNPASVDDQYTTNALNQYTAKENNTVRVAGTAVAGANVAVKDAVANKKDRAWGADLVPANTGGAVKGTATAYAATLGSPNLLRSESKDYFIPQAAQSFTYDADGNLTADGVWSYTWNAENQLVRVTSLLPGGFGFTRVRLDFKYDHMRRRVEKRVFNLDSSTETLARRFLYDGWNLVAELDGSGSAMQRSYTWGLDLAGSLERSGGVGALMRMTNYSSGTPGTSYYPTYDGNGNVVSLVNATTGNLAAVYEYDPFGNFIRNEVIDSAVADNPFRFSTKYYDTESGLSYFGMRYYSATLGRFMGRDPVDESGGLNLYAFVGNNSVNRVDYLGLIEFALRPLLSMGLGFDAVPISYPTGPNSSRTIWIEIGQTNEQKRAIIDMINRSGMNGGSQSVGGGGSSRTGGDVRGGQDTTGQGGDTVELDKFLVSTTRPTAPEPPMFNVPNVTPAPVVVTSAPNKTPCAQATEAYNAAVTKFNQLRGASNTALAVRDAYKAAISKDSLWQDAVNNAPDIMDVMSSIADGPWTSVPAGAIKTWTYDLYQRSKGDIDAADVLTVAYGGTQSARWFVGWVEAANPAIPNAAANLQSTTASIGRANAALLVGALAIENIKIYGPGYLNMVNQNGTLIDMNSAVLERQEAALGSLEDVKRAATAKDAACK